MTLTNDEVVVLYQRLADAWPGDMPEGSRREWFPVLAESVSYRLAAQTLDRLIREQQFRPSIAVFVKARAARQRERNQPPELPPADCEICGGYGRIEGIDNVWRPCLAGCPVPSLEQRVLLASRPLPRGERPPPREKNPTGGIRPPNVCSAP